MNEIRLPYIILVLLFLFADSPLGYAGSGKTNSISQQRPQTQQEQLKVQSLDINKKNAQLLRLSAVFEDLAATPINKTLQNEQNKEIQRYNRWLRKTSRELKQFINQWQSKLQGFKTSKQMQEIQMSFNLQYLQLQNKLAHDNRQFTLISNIMKNKHDTAKNAISNIR